MEEKVYQNLFSTDLHRYALEQLGNRIYKAMTIEVCNKVGKMQASKLILSLLWEASVRTLEPWS